MKKRALVRKRIIVWFLSLCLVLQSVIFTVAAEENESVEEVIIRGFYEFSESIDISRFEIAPNELSAVVSSVIKDDPYLFFVNGHLSYSCLVDGHVLSLKPTYDMTEDETFAAWEYCRRTAREIAERATEYGSDHRRALFVHDYICHGFEYDETLESDDLFSFFENGKGTCQGYAAAYMAVLRELGIPCHFVASDTISHIWNLVEMDGEWYHVDLTWDDSAGDGSRRHFLLSDKVAAERGHRDWYSAVGVECGSDKYLDADFGGWLGEIHLSGDGDHDGNVSLADLLCLRRLISLEIFEDVCSECADINSDGHIDVADVDSLRKKLLILD